MTHHLVSSKSEEQKLQIVLLGNVLELEFELLKKCWGAPESPQRIVILHQKVSVHSTSSAARQRSKQQQQQSQQSRQQGRGADSSSSKSYEQAAGRAKPTSATQFHGSNCGQVNTDK